MSLLNCFTWLLANTINQIKQKILPRTFYKGIRHNTTSLLKAKTNSPTQGPLLSMVWVGPQYLSISIQLTLINLSIPRSDIKVSWLPWDSNVHIFSHKGKKDIGTKIHLK